MTNESGGWFFGQEGGRDERSESDESFEILDRNRDKQSGEILSFLVMEDGEPIPKKATPTNVLLY